MSIEQEKATLGGGCFWCIEAIFQRLQGVSSVVSGYSGGHVENPTYEQVTSKKTGHAEVIQLAFDPKKISYAELLEVFFHLHDPTTLNRQGADEGPQYRSVIFFHSPEQEKAAREVKAQIEREHLWSDPIVTEIAPFKEFYAAENYHQNYYNLNKEKPYCSIVIAPKIQKLLKKFAHKLKPASEVR